MHPPISAELYARLRRFDPHYRISMERREPYRHEWRQMVRTWHVRIAPERGHGMAHDVAGAEHPTLAEAVRLAVEAAEARGWHQ